MPCLVNRRQAFAGLAAVAAACAGALHAADAMNIEPWPADKPTPDLRAADLAGQPRTLADYRGRALLLNFWASWCVPCRAELPSLAELAQFHAGQDLAVVTVNFKESGRLVRRFFEPRGLQLPVLLDPEGAVAARWGVRIFPTTVLVDAAGRARWIVRGEADWTSTQADALITRLTTSTRTS